MDNQPIESIEKLLEVLPTCKANEFVHLAQRLKIPKEQFDAYATWSNAKYTRNCIDRTDQYELLLLCWEKGLKTPIHCHGGEECWVFMIDGKIKEIRVAEDNQGNLVEKSAEIMEKGGISYMNDSMGYHSLYNLADGRSMSLHLYMNPIDRCRVYCEESQSFDFKDLCYDTFRGRPVKSMSEVVY